MKLELHDALVFGLPLAATSITLAALHWFPWHGGAQELRRTTAYAVGTAVVVGYPVLTMMIVALLGGGYSEWFWATLMLANVASAGTTVHGAYWIDGRKAVGRKDI